MMLLTLEQMLQSWVRRDSSKFLLNNDHSYVKPRELSSSRGTVGEQWEVEVKMIMGVGEYVPLSADHLLLGCDFIDGV